MGGHPLLNKHLSGKILTFGFKKPMEKPMDSKKKKLILMDSWIPFKNQWIQNISHTKSHTNRPCQISWIPCLVRCCSLFWGVKNLLMNLDLLGGGVINTNLALYKYTIYIILFYFILYYDIVRYHMIWYDIILYIIILYYVMIYGMPLWYITRFFIIAQTTVSIRWLCREAAYQIGWYS